MTPRECTIRDWAAGSYPDGRPHIPDGCESFTRDLLDIIDGMRSFASEAAEVLSEYGNGTTDEDIGALRDLAFSVAPDWSAKKVPTRAELLATIDAMRETLRLVADDVYDPPIVKHTPPPPSRCLSG